MPPDATKHIGIDKKARFSSPMRCKNCGTVVGEDPLPSSNYCEECGDGPWCLNCVDILLACDYDDVLSQDDFDKKVRHD